MSMARRHRGMPGADSSGGKEPEYCDDCGESVGHYDPRLRPGEKIVITRKCACVRREEARRASC